MHWLFTWSTSLAIIDTLRHKWPIQIVFTLRYCNCQYFPSIKYDSDSLKCHKCHKYTLWLIYLLPEVEHTDPGSSTQNDVSVSYTPACVGLSIKFLYPPWSSLRFLSICVGENSFPVCGHFIFVWTFPLYNFRRFATPNQRSQRLPFSHHHNHHHRHYPV